MKNYILFFDSGVGGLSILDYFFKLKNKVNAIYYADVINFPYGMKDERTIGNILLSIYGNLKKLYNIDLVTIACNTASISALDIFRKHVDIPVIGTVPAIKVAAEYTKKNRIGIIGTETTVRLDYIRKLIDQYAKDKEVFVKATKTLADAVEYSFEGDRLKKTLEYELEFFKDKDIDALVLGCTHYSLLYDEINSYFEGKIRIIDSCGGVSKRILHLLPKTTLTDNPDHILYVSGGDRSTSEKYESLNLKLKLFDRIIIEDLSCQKV
jgi:glutamate racemase